MGGSTVVFQLLSHIIPLILWLVALIFAVKMVKMGGGKPERFLLIGASLMLASSVVDSAWAGLTPWLVPRLAHTGTDLSSIALIFSVVNFVRSLISVAGVICLICAFWQKFRAKPASP